MGDAVEHVKAHTRDGYHVSAYDRSSGDATQYNATSAMDKIKKLQAEAVARRAELGPSRYDSPEAYFDSAGVLTKDEAAQLKALMVQSGTAGLTVADSKRLRELLAKLKKAKG